MRVKYRSFDALTLHRPLLVDPCCLGNDDPAALPSYWKDVKMQIGADPENPGRTGRNGEAKRRKLPLSTLSVIHFLDRSRVRCCGHTGFISKREDFFLRSCAIYYRFNH